MINTNSLLAYRELEDKHSRQQVVLKIYLENALPLTDRQIFDVLHKVDPKEWKDLNAVRPRISELIDEGDLAPLEYKVIDEETHKKVRVCRVSTPEEKQAAQERKLKYSEQHNIAHPKPFLQGQQLVGFGVRRAVTNAERVA